MQVTQTSSQGLKQEFKVVLPAADLAAKLGAQLAEMQAKAQIKGFRPGKAPIAHLKKLYGKGIMGDVLQEAVNEANRKIVEEHELRIAVEPKLDFPGGQEELERALEAEGDLAFTVTFETLPKFEIGSFDDISIERPVAEVADADIDTALKNLADRAQEFEPRAEGAKAEKDDKLTIDFTGKLDGVPFEGGTGGDIDLVLGSNTFIPGFEEQLEGAAVGEQRQVKVKFPEDYSAQHLAGKDAEFDVTVKAIAAPKSLEIGEELAKKYGFENFDAMKEAVKSNLEADFHKVSRDKLKRALLDALDSRYSFDLPETLVEQEFNNIWGQHEAESRRANQPVAEEGKTEEETRAEFRKIAERRVRLGLVLAEIGQNAGVKVEDKDLTEALVERVRMFPGQEKQVWDFYRNNEQALAQLRAPIYEERVVDHISKLIKITDKTVTKEELFKEEDEA
ncbi:trigger factor [Methylocystis sp. MJC1]|jgi:trigger factor|uniref:trigger factor n=1 Tax=Methylocystis sp. MJC1 TaxID=2654282 RepID=UPI0013EC1F51|nr:trigger factor [Methylocystis sp. MJC1]KAF2992298.1 Trigger factor [Methylocystis sp. MJC1]MBU6527437.1 trigger factor [Methylocystis sp. MJC1]UZX10383.1 trigger factor [Methylocystis sp. MJC1]